MLVMTCFVLERDSRRRCDSLVVLANAEPYHDSDHETRDEHIAGKYQEGHINALRALPRRRWRTGPAIGDTRLLRRAPSCPRAPRVPIRSFLRHTDGPACA